MDENNSKIETSGKYCTNSAFKIIKGGESTPAEKTVKRRYSTGSDPENSPPATSEDIEAILSGGWVKLFRNIKEKGWYKKSSDHVHLYIHLHLCACHAEREIWWNGKSVRLKPGQFTTGQNMLARETGIHPKKVYRILDTFEIEKIIEKRTCSTSTLITILNWNFLQGGVQPNVQEVRNGSQTDEKPVRTKQEGKERKNEKNIKKERGLSPIEIKVKYGLTDDQFSGFTTTLEFVNKTAPALQKLEQPLNLEDIVSISAEFPDKKGQELFFRVIKKINEFPSLSKYKSAVLAVKKWMKTEWPDNENPSGSIGRGRYNGASNIGGAYRAQLTEGATTSGTL